MNFAKIFPANTAVYTVVYDFQIFIYIPVWFHPAIFTRTSLVSFSYFLRFLLVLEALIISNTLSNTFLLILFYNFLCQNRNSRSGQSLSLSIINISTQHYANKKTIMYIICLSLLNIKLRSTFNNMYKLAFVYNGSINCSLQQTPPWPSGHSAASHTYFPSSFCFCSSRTSPD